MPECEIGTIAKGKAIGKNPPSANFIWAACSVCGKRRWVVMLRSKPKFNRCHSCQYKSLSVTNRAKPKVHMKGSTNPGWRGGRVKRAGGYIGIWVSSDDPFYPMADKSGYVLEHRLIVAKKLGRCLLKAEHVHHRDGIKDHNEDSNLELISPANHALYGTMCANCELRKEIRLLRWQVMELTSALQEKLKI